jgi:hypothetical protein
VVDARLSLVLPEVQEDKQFQPVSSAEVRVHDQRARGLLLQDLHELEHLSHEGLALQ